jgi:hypothetical protein
VSVLPAATVVLQSRVSALQAMPWPVTFPLPETLTRSRTGAEEVVVGAVVVVVVVSAVTIGVVVVVSIRLPEAGVATEA